MTSTPPVVSVDMSTGESWGIVFAVVGWFHRHRVNSTILFLSLLLGLALLWGGSESAKYRGFLVFRYIAVHDAVFLDVLH